MKTTNSFQLIASLQFSSINQLGSIFSFLCSMNRKGEIVVLSFLSFFLYASVSPIQYLFLISLLLPTFAEFFFFFLFFSFLTASRW